MQRTSGLVDRHRPQAIAAARRIVRLDGIELEREARFYAVVTSGRATRRCADRPAVLEEAGSATDDVFAALDEERATHDLPPDEEPGEWRSLSPPLVNRPPYAPK